MKPPSGRKRERGSSLVEFSVSFALLFAIFTGVFQFGHSFYLYHRLESAVRGAARHASMRTYDSASATPSEQWVTAVKNMAVYGNPDGTGQPIVAGFTRANVNVAMTFLGGVPGRVAVRVTNYRIDAMFTSYTMQKPEATFQYMGRYAPE
jgi:Flp pilus assembly protein TadG